MLGTQGLPYQKGNALRYLLGESVRREVFRATLSNAFSIIVLG